MPSIRQEQKIKYMLTSLNSNADSLSEVIILRSHRIHLFFVANQTIVKEGLPVFTQSVILPRSQTRLIYQSQNVQPRIS